MVFNLWTPNFVIDGWWVVVMAVLILWSVIWKGVALWEAARSSQKNWFIALLVINTVGILEILYIFVFSKNKKTSSPKTSKKEAQIKEI